MEADCGVDADATSEPLTAIGMALAEIATQNDIHLQESGEREELTFFHGDSVPDISVQDYVQRLRYYQCSAECYVIAVVLLDRFLAAAPQIRLSSYTAHRLIVTAVVLAVKSVDDDYKNNSFYAHVGGVPVRELNRMELTFLKVINFDLYVSPHVYETSRERLRWYLVDRAVSLGTAAPYPAWDARHSSDSDTAGPAEPVVLVQPEAYPVSPTDLAHMVPTHPFSPFVDDVPPGADVAASQAWPLVDVVDASVTEPTNHTPAGSAGPCAGLPESARDSDHGPQHCSVSAYDTNPALVLSLRLLGHDA